MIIIKTKIIGNQIIFLTETTSTNDIIKNYAQNQEPEGLVVVANSQTKGRGRSGKVWYSQAGGLYFSILLRPQLPLSEIAKLTLLTGVTLVEVLRKHHQLPVLLKWPNDVLINNRKLAGILVEMATSGANAKHLVVGIGINTNQQAIDQEIAEIAISMESILNKPIDNKLLLSKILKRFEHNYQLFTAQKYNHFIDLVKKYSATIGRNVTVITEEETYLAKAIDITAKGQLVVEKTNGTRHLINSGEVSIRSSEPSRKELF